MENICVVLRRMGTASVVLLPSCRASLEFLVIITLLEVVSCPYPPSSGHALQPWHASEEQPEAAQRTDFHKSQNRVNPENTGCGSSSLQGHYSTQSSSPDCTSNKMETLWDALQLQTSHSFTIDTVANSQFYIIFVSPC